MLVDIDDIKSYCSIKSSDTDDLFDTLSASAQALLDDWLGRTLESASHTYDFSGDGTNFVILKNRPVSAITQVLIDIDSANEITSTGYEFFDERGVVRLHINTFPKGNKNCRVAYTGGYSAQTLPKTLKLAIMQLAALMYKESGPGEFRLGKASVNQADGGTISFVDKLPKMTMQALSRYRNLSF